MGQFAKGRLSLWRKQNQTLKRKCAHSDDIWCLSVPLFRTYCGNSWQITTHSVLLTSQLLLAKLLFHKKNWQILLSMLNVMRPCMKSTINVHAFPDKEVFCSKLSYVLMLLGIGECYPNAPPWSPLIGYADRSEQTGCEDSKWLSWHGSLISSSISYSHFESSSVSLRPSERGNIRKKRYQSPQIILINIFESAPIANVLVHRTPCKLKYCTNKLGVDVKNAIRLQSGECYQKLSCLTISFIYLSLKEHRHLAGRDLRLPVQLISL